MYPTYGQHPQANGAPQQQPQQPVTGAPQQQAQQQQAYPGYNYQYGSYGQYGAYGQQPYAYGYGTAQQQPATNYAYQYGYGAQTGATGAQQPVTTAQVAQQPAATAYGAYGYGVQQQPMMQAAYGAYNAQYGMPAQANPAMAQYGMQPQQQQQPQPPPQQPATHSAFQNRKRKRSDSPGGGQFGYGNSVPKRQVRISNLPERLSNNPEELKRTLSRCGRIMCMNIPHYHDTGKPRNYAFVKFSTPDEASRCCAEFNNKSVMGNSLEVLIANKQAEYSGRTNTIQVENLTFDTDERALKEEFSKHGEIINFKLVKHHRSGRATAIIEYRYGQSVQSALNEFHDEIYVGEAVESSNDPANKRRKLEYAENMPTMNDYDARRGSGSNKSSMGGGSYRESSHPSSMGGSSSQHNNFDDSVCEVYVGHLPPQLSNNKDELKRIFDPFGVIENINIIQDHINGQPKGIAYIRFQSPQAARQACEHLNRSTYYGRSIIVQPSKRQQQAQTKTKAPSGETSNEFEVYIANLPSNLTENDVRNDLCGSFRHDIDTVRLATDPPRALVKFSTRDTATRVLLALNESDFRGRRIMVRYAISSDYNEGMAPIVPPSEHRLACEVHVGNLPYDHCNETAVSKIFSVCGKIVDVRLPAPHRQSNMPRGFAFVQFADVDAALRALSLHGRIVDNRAINVSYPKVATRAGRDTSRSSASPAKKSALRTSPAKTDRASPAEPSRKSESPQRTLEEDNRHVSPAKKEEPEEENDDRSSWSPSASSRIPKKSARLVKEEQKSDDDEEQHEYEDLPPALDVKQEEEETNFEKSGNAEEEPVKKEDFTDVEKEEPATDGPMEGQAMQMGSEPM